MAFPTDPSGALPIVLGPELLDLILEAAYICDADQRIRYCNSRMVKLWGRQLRCDDAGERLPDLLRFVCDDGSFVSPDQCPSATALQIGEPQRNCRAVIKRPDGTHITVTVDICPIRDPSGVVFGALGVVQNIDEQEPCWDKPRLKETQLHALISALPAAIYIADRDGRITFFNEAAAELWGRRPELGKEMWCGSLRILRPDGSPMPFDQCPMAIALREGRRIRGEEILIERPDGQRRHVMPYPEPLRDESGEIVGAVNMLVDTTDSGQAVIERNLLASIVESSDDIIASKTLDGILTSWNSGAERILGYSAEEVIGKHVSMLMPPENVEDTHKILGHIGRGERVDHYETKRRRKDGAIIDVSLTVSPIRDIAGEVIGASKVGRDITEQKRTAAALSEANRRKDEFLAMLAHELRNPLSAIGNAVLVARKCELDETLRWSTEVIERQVRQLARLVDDLLDVSRISRGKIQIRPEVVDIGPILNCAVDTVRPLIEERKHKLSVAFGSGTLRVKADPVRLEQIVVNLLTNAAKYTESGGHIWLTAEQDGSEVAIQVRDTGIGILPEKLPQMFELFVQGDRSLARSEGGLGIGLTLVKSLVTMHQGTISASSEGPGKGSEFTVRLPAAVGPRIEAIKTPFTSNSRTRTSHILVVDDNADSAKGLARLLRLLGHDVRMAHDGPGAVTIAEAFQPDVVLLDIGLPGMDGYQVARQLREIEACKNSVIVAISGYGQEEDRQRGREAGFDFHFVKPIDQDALLTLLSAN